MSVTGPLGLPGTFILSYLSVVSAMGLYVDCSTKLALKDFFEMFLILLHMRFHPQVDLLISERSLGIHFKILYPCHLHSFFYSFIRPCQMHIFEGILWCATLRNSNAFLKVQNTPGLPGLTFFVCELKFNLRETIVAIV